jgi:general secretion pathway protein G
LIELLLVLVILAILAAVVVNNFGGTTLKAKISAAKTDIGNLKTALRMFELDAGHYPTTEQGLQALTDNPGSEPNWKKYIDKLPPDPWGHPYLYRIPGSNGKDFDLFSCGPDGHEGGGDDVE